MKIPDPRLVVRWIAKATGTVVATSREPDAITEPTGLDAAGWMAVAEALASEAAGAKDPALRSRLYERSGRAGIKARELDARERAKRPALSAEEIDRRVADALAGYGRATGEPQDAAQNT